MSYQNASFKASNSANSCASNSNNQYYKANNSSNTIEKIYVKWCFKEGMCEICGMRKATVNLDLKSGSHRECRFCWDS